MWEAGRMGLVFVGTCSHRPPHISFKTSQCSKLGWSADGRLGPDAGDSIRSVLQTATDVYAAVGNKVIKYFRGKEVGRLQAPDESVLGTMILLGDDLMALKEDGTGVIIWNTKTGGM